MMLPLPFACMARTSCFMLSTTPRTLVSMAAARPMPVKAPVISTTGLLIFRFLMVADILPAEHGSQRREAEKGPWVSPEGASMIGQVGTAGACAKDFIS